MSGSDKSETCKNMKCSNPTSASFCVMRPGKKAPTDCSRIINQDCYGTIDFGRSRSEWFEACHEERARKKYHDLCQAFENVGENITFMTKDSGKHCGKHYRLTYMHVSILCFVHITCNYIL